MRRPGTVERHECLDVLDLFRGKARHMAVVFQASFAYPWTRGLKASRWRVEVKFKHDRWQTLPVVWTHCHFGGERPWFLCPFCSNRFRKLYNAGSFCACRACCNLRYASQRRGARSRRYLQALKLRLKLDGIASLTEPFPERPRGMHRKTYERFRRRAEALEQDLRTSRFMRRETDYSVLVPL